MTFEAPDRLRRADPTMAGSAPALRGGTGRVAVVGVGYVGLPAAVMLADAGLDVTGVDINPQTVDAINRGDLASCAHELGERPAAGERRGRLRASLEPVEADAFIIAVPTPIKADSRTADLSYVEAATRSICPKLRPGNLVIVESTVPPLTTTGLIRGIIEGETGLRVPQDILLAHCPERILPGAIWQEIIHNDRLIGGIDAASTQAAIDLYAAFVEGALIPTTATVAEMSKIMENVYRDVNIALANECALICDTLALDPAEVIALANRHPRVNILSPGIGVGGHCIPVDPWFLKEAAPAEARLIATARLVNDEMPGRAARRIRAALDGVAAPRVVALGAAYKRDCDDCRESPAGEIVRMLRADGMTVAHFDPLVRGMGYDDLAAVSAGADLVVVLVHHSRIAADLACLGDVPLLDLDPR